MRGGYRPFAEVFYTVVFPLQRAGTVRSIVRAGHDRSAHVKRRIFVMVAHEFHDIPYAEFFIRFYPKRHAF